MVGQWKGKYDYSFGATGITLTVKGDARQGLTGEVHFYPVPENLQVKEGRYLVEGSVNETTGIISFRATQWVNRPGVYRLASLVGTLSADRLTFQGAVDQSTRHKFKLAKE
jgi:hypothetical protein